ncbi:MAG: hypothetical protein OXI34_11510 [Chloroflexota bacterium]|nr:hypothetical protein [Chloroflexota bacterium]MDE2947681.1 hypothetical protein [Chloroflexota bacterium]
MEANRSQTGCLKTSLIMIGSALIFIAAIVLIGDLKCAYDVENWWMPLYPNGETVDVEYDFLRPRAWGTTTWIMTTTDDVETVKQFYRDTRLFTLKNKARGIAWGESNALSLEQAVEAADTRLNSLVNDFENAPEAEKDERAAAIEREEAWRAMLFQRLEAGHRSRIILLSVCGI